MRVLWSLLIVPFSLSAQLVDPLRVSLADPQSSRRPDGNWQVVQAFKVDGKVQGPNDLLFPLIPASFKLEEFLQMRVSRGQALLEWRVIGAASLRVGALSSPDGSREHQFQSPPENIRGHMALDHKKFAQRIMELKMGNSKSLVWTELYYEDLPISFVLGAKLAPGLPQLPAPAPSDGSPTPPDLSE